MIKPLHPWGPWEKNPSKSENFYEMNEEYSDLTEDVESEEQLIASVTEEVTEEVEEEVEDIEESCKTPQEPLDPYSDILKDLK